MGNLPPFKPTEKQVFINNFMEIWGVHPSIFTGFVPTFKNGDKGDHYRITTMDGHPIFLAQLRNSPSGLGIPV
jgi:hypothetical protein